MQACGTRPFVPLIIIILIRDKVNDFAVDLQVKVWYDECGQRLTSRSTGEREVMFIV
jgi:hypothetical protein